MYLPLLDVGNRTVSKNRDHLYLHGVCNLVREAEITQVTRLRPLQTEVSAVSEEAAVFMCRQHRKLTYEGRQEKLPPMGDLLLKRAMKDENYSHEGWRGREHTCKVQGDNGEGCEAGQMGRLCRAGECGLHKGFLIPSRKNPKTPS